MISPNYLTSTSTITHLVDNMVINQELKEVQEHKKHMPPELFLREFQAVRIQLPRASGHSSAAAQLWQEYKALVMFPQQRFADRFIHDILARKLSVSFNKHDYVKTRCMSFGSTAEVNRLPERLLPFVGVSEQELPQLLVFDQASWFGRDWCNGPTEVRNMRRMLNQLWDWNDRARAEELFDRALHGSQHPDQIIDQITHITFARIPTIKGVVVLQ